MSNAEKHRPAVHIKTRIEAWLVTYAIAVGAVERGRHYIEMYPGTMAAGCWRWPAPASSFIAGAKLLDSVKPEPVAVKTGRHAPPVQRRQSQRLVVIDPERARCVPVQGHGLHIA